MFLAANVRLVGENETAGDPDVPVPVSPTVWGLPAASSATLTDALRAAATVGVKVTEILQLELAARAAGQLLVCAKSPAFVPPMLMLVMVSVELPVLLSVTELAPLVVLTTWLPNATLAGASETTGVTPVPESAAVCGLPAALSATLSDAERDPVAEGVNVRTRLHVPPTGRVPGQKFVRPKSPAFAPVRVTLEMVSVAVPELVSTIVCVGLATPTR